MKLIKFKLEKDYDKRRLLFTLIGYNRDTLYNGKTFHIDFINKRVYQKSSWYDCYINESQFSISFSGSINPREYYPFSSDKKHSLFRLSDSCQIQNPYILRLEDGEDVDVMYDRIVEAFKILSIGVK